MQDPTLGPIEPRKMSYPVPGAFTRDWEQADWDAWAQRYGELEPLVLRTQNLGTWHAVGQDANGKLLYRLNTEGEV